MNILWAAALIVVAVTAIAVAAMLMVRRGAAEGSYYNKSSNVVGVSVCWRQGSPSCWAS